MNPEQLPLRDIHMPVSVPWWPLAPGWWVLLASGIAAMAAVYFVYRRYRKNKGCKQRISACRAARAELDRILALASHGQDDARVAQQLSALLRRLAISLFPEQKVAGVTGSEWWRWLDARAQTAVFDGPDGAGARLESAAYGAVSTDIAALIDAVESWMKDVCRERAS